MTSRLPDVGVGVIENFSSGYHARNGGGDRILTDGDLPILDLRSVEAPSDRRPRRRTAVTGGRRRPGFGSAIALLRALAYILIAASPWPRPTGPVSWRTRGWTTTSWRCSPTPWPSIGVVAAVMDVVLAIAVLRGRNWARVSLMAVCAFTAASVFVATVGRDGHPVGFASLPTLSASILVLLALSSRPARQYATRQPVRQPP